MSDRSKNKSARFVVLGCLVVPVVLVGLLSPPSWSGACYLLGLTLIWLGLSKNAHKRLRWAGLGLFMATVTLRMFTGGGGRFSSEQVGESNVAGGALARLVHERDLSGGASTLLNAFSVLPERGGTLGPLFRETYDQMDAAGDHAPSPLLSTLLLGQSPESFEMLRYRVDGARGTLVFLHGYGGNIGAICWEVAQSAMEAGFETLCPSTGTPGDWGSARGGEILRSTLELARGPVVLAGLSAGAKGAALLAPRFRRDIEGLVLIAGAAQRAVRAGVPTLVLYGRHDAMFPPRIMRAYVERTRAQSLVLDAGHFIVLSERERVRPALTRFLNARLH